MIRPGTLCRAVVATAILGTTVGIASQASVAAEPCREVVSFARAVSTVARVDASSGAALAAPAVYSAVLFDSIPNIAYNQSGPTSLGQLEDPTGTNPNTLAPTAWGFLPIDPPVPAPSQLFGPNPPFIPAPPSTEGRAEAAFPRLEGIPQDSENATGPTSAEAHAYPTFSQGRASSVGLGDAEGGVRSGSAFTHATLECETLTLVVGWEANGVTTAGGTIPTMSQVATLVISPSGSSADVVTHVSETTEEGDPIISGQPLANPVLDGFAENGTYVEVGEPTVTAEDTRASVTGGGIRYGTSDPSRNDTFTFYTIGSMEGLVELGSVLPPRATAPGAPTPTPEAATPPATSPAATSPGQTTQVVRTAGEPPAASPAATEFAAAQIQLSGITEDLTTGSYPIGSSLLALLALGLIGRTAWYGADKGRDRFPTGGYAVDWFRIRGRRFATTYLAW